jgi:hypothetical protein
MNLPRRRPLKIVQDQDVDRLGVREAQQCVKLTILIARERPYNFGIKGESLANVSYASR